MTAGTPRKLCFVVTEDWFFASHFLPMARAARELGFEPVVVTRVRNHRSAIEAVGARVVPLESERRSFDPIRTAFAAGQLARIFKAEGAEVVHCIGLKSIVVGGAAAALAGIRRRVYAVTGMGLIGARQDTVGTVGRTILRSAIRSLNTSQTYYVFENPEYAETLGLNASRGDRLTLVGGAGVSLEAFEPSVLPPQPPLKVAVVARMLWSKGIDLAVSAVEQARSRGAPVELSLYGAPDPGNPKAIPEETLRAWNALPGIRWHGPVADVGAVWRLHHVACLPSRGGEGLPRTLLESAAAGRAIVTTDVPGCRRLVRDGVQGFVVPPEDDSALADALARLASDPELVARMGAAGRERIAEGFTERAVMNQIQQVYLQAFA